MKPRRLTPTNHLAAALDRVTAENARLVQACDALLAERAAARDLADSLADLVNQRKAERDAAALDERARVVKWLEDMAEWSAQQKGEDADWNARCLESTAGKIAYGEHLEEK